MKFAFYTFGLWLIGIGTGVSIDILQSHPILLWICVLGWGLLVIAFSVIYVKTE